jgi:hypothetical protein
VKAPLELARVGWTLALTLGIAGCFSWRPYEPAVPLAQSPGLPYRLRATLDDSSQVELTSPFVRAGTLYGRSGRIGTPWPSPSPPSRGSNGSG